MKLLIVLDPFRGLIPQDIYLVKDGSIKKTGSEFVCSFLDLACFDYVDTPSLTPRLFIGWGDHVEDFTPNLAEDKLKAIAAEDELKNVFFAFQFQAKDNNWISGKAITATGPSQEGFYSYRFSKEGIAYTFNYKPNRLSWLE